MDHSTNSVINFIDEVNKQRSLDEEINKINDDPIVKLRRLDETKKQGVNACMNSILTKICKDAIPEVNGRVSCTPDLDKVVADYISRRTGGKDLEFYVKEAIKRNPKNTEVIKNILESVEKIVNDRYEAKTLNPDEIKEDDYKFDVTPEIDDKLTAIIRDNNLDDLADVIKDNVRDTAIAEVELAKKEKEERMALEEELTNDTSITTESALEEALRARGYGSTSVYTPSLFEAVMINKFNGMNIRESVMHNMLFDSTASYMTEGVVDKIKNTFKIKAEADAKETIAKNHPEFLVTITELYKAVYAEYRSKVSPINVKKISTMIKEVLSNPNVSNITIKGIDLNAVKTEAATFKEKMKGLMESKTYEKFVCPKDTKDYSANDAVSEMVSVVKALDSYFGKPDVKAFTNKASSYVTVKANKCENPKEVKTVYALAIEYYVAEIAYYSSAISFVASVAEAAKNIIKKYDNTDVKESAFDSAVTEYTLLNISKALYLESFSISDVDNLALFYSEM